MTTDGQPFMCSKHGIDYRITCDECNDKYTKFSEQVTQVRIANYREQAQKEGRICKVCGCIKKDKDWCPVCERRNASKRGIEHLKTEKPL